MCGLAIVFLLGSVRISHAFCSIYLPRGALVFEVGYHPRKKIHVIRVVFQDKAIYERQGVQNVQNWEKKVCFWLH